MNRMEFFKTYYKTKLFLSLTLFIFTAGILYSQSYTNLDNTYTNLPTSQRLANNISIRQMGEGSLYVEWEGIYHPNLTYYVYRSNNPILSRPLITTAAVIGSVKATNNSSSYSMLDILPSFGTYYYAVISYVDNIGFYTADSDVDTVSFDFRGPSPVKTINTNANTNTNTIATNTNNNNTNAYTLILVTGENETNSDIISNISNIVISNSVTENINTNYMDYITNIINTNYMDYIYTTNTMNTNNNENIDGIVNTNSIEITIDNVMENPPEFQTEYDMYMNEYNKALAQFKLGNYSTVVTLLEPVSAKNVNRNLYYNINLLLGRAYKNTSQKQNALNVFRRIQSINPTEVNFWVNQVLSDL